MAARSFRFRPRYRGVAWTAIGTGGTLAAVSAATLAAAAVPIAAGVIGIALGAAYLVSPSWKLEVVVDAEALEVRRAGAARFRLPWRDVVRVVASPSTKTCFVDGGTPENSLLVPGVGAPAPYAIESSGELYDAIVMSVATDKLSEVATLEAR